MRVGRLRVACMAHGEPLGGSGEEGSALGPMRRGRHVHGGPWRSPARAVRSILDYVTHALNHSLVC